MYHVDLFWNNNPKIVHKTYSMAERPDIHSEDNGLVYYQFRDDRGYLIYGYCSYAHCWKDPDIKEGE